MKMPIKSYWILLRTYLHPQWRRIILLAVLLALKITSRLVNPQIVRGFLDQALAGTTTEALLRQGALFLVIAAASQIFTVISVTIGETVAWTSCAISWTWIWPSIRHTGPENSPNALTLM